MTRREMVEEFMLKHNIALNAPLPTLSGRLLDAGRMLLRVRDTLKIEDEDELRASLLIEELAEHLIGVAQGDLIAAADGLGDLAYVVEGSAARYNLPLGKLFDEIHRSNMSKQVSTTRVKDKGPNYVPPDVMYVLVNEGPCKACVGKHRDGYCACCKQRLEMLSK